MQVGSGGTIPFVAEFTSAFPNAAVLITGAGADNHSRPHGIDENIDIGELERACRAEALLIAERARKDLFEGAGEGETKTPTPE